MTYTPPQKILERYASVLVDFALGGGEGVHPGEVVRVVAPESAKPLYVELQKAVWRAGGHVIGSYQPDDDHIGMSLRILWDQRHMRPAQHHNDSAPAKFIRQLICARGRARNDSDSDQIEIQMIRDRFNALVN